MIKCTKFTKIVLPKIAKQEINIFEKSQTNFIRSVNNLHSGGIAINDDLSKVIINDVEFMSNNPVPRLLSHKEVPKKNESNRHSWFI